MLKLKTYLSLGILFFCIIHCYGQAPKPVVNLIDVREKCRQLLLSDTAYATEQSFLLTDDIIYDKNGDGYFSALNAEGFWPDIDYKSDINSAWPACRHLYRLMLIYRAYHRNHNEAYFKAVHNALTYWIKLDPLCGNWWQNQINIPYVYSSIMLMLAEQATANELLYMDKVLSPRVQQKGATGQNKIWQHDIEARMALVHNDEVKFKNAVLQMQSVITIGTNEGIQPDYSFHQHGAMLQFGNYGTHFVNSLLFWIKVTAGSPFRFDPEKQQIVSDYCVKGLRYTIYKKAMDMTAIGRQLRNNSGTKRGQALYDDMNLLRSFAKQDKCAFNISGFNKEPNCNELPNKSFWRSAYMIHSNPRLMMSVKMQGPLVKPVESINLENLKGAFLNDGVTLIRRTGREYENIEPLWNWNMLPGTTCDTTADATAAQTFKAANTSGFVGLVSDNKIGISAMYYNRLGVSAYKSYFFVGDMLIALGADVTSADKGHLITTVNQRFKNGNKLYSGQSPSGQKWLWHDSTSYFFPDNKQVIKTAVERRTGNWNTVDKVSANRSITDSVVTIYTPHQNIGTYAYIIKPGVSLNETRAMAHNSGVKILGNTKQVQAISFKNTWMVVFYQAGTIKLNNKMKLSANSPCMVICNKQQNIWIADPSRKLDQVILKLNAKTLTAALPKGDYAGSSVKAAVLTSK